MSTERFIAIAAGVLGAALWVYVFLLVAGCRRPVPSREPTDATRPWCFALSGTYRNVEQSGIVCVEYERTCYDARESARLFGKWRGVTSVGECGYRP